MSGVIFHEGRPLAPMPDPAHVKQTVLQITAKLQHDALLAAWSPAHSAYMRGHLDGWHEGFRAASVDRSPKGEKPQALNAKHESAVAESQTPSLESSIRTNPDGE